MQPTRHGAAAAEIAAPERPDWTIDQNWEDYTATEHAVWKRLFERQARLLPDRACEDFLEGLRQLDFEHDEIPDFENLNARLAGRTGWRVVPVAGLVPDQVFFDHLANRRFPAGRFIRAPAQLDYIEEPDIFHDVFGHVPMLMHPVFADYMQAYGEGGLRAQKLGTLPHLARVYWYTVEFGLVGPPGGLRIYGSGILSSHAETRFALEDRSPHRVRFDLERVMRTQYRIDDFQEIYFALSSLDDLLELARIDFAPFYERAARASPLTPGEIAPEDEVIDHGTGTYHQGRRRH